MTTDPTRLRKNVRAKLNFSIVLTGSDRDGKPFEVRGRTLDFSRTGLGAVVSNGTPLAKGAILSISDSGQFRGTAEVQWIRPDPDGKSTRVGLRLIQSKTAIGLKIAASFLLFFAFLSQATFARSGSPATLRAPVAVSQTQQPESQTMADRVEDSGSWIEQAIEKANGNRPAARKAVVSIRMSKESYATGETVAASGYRLSNPSSTKQSVELKTWMKGPGVSPISIGNVGADGTYVVEAGADEEYGPVDLLPVSSRMLGGKGEFSARILDPVTGEILGETIKDFTLNTGAGGSAQNNDHMPSLDVDFQLGKTTYHAGDTVALDQYRITNRGATEATVEAKVWLEAPGLDPIAVFSLGADGSLVLTPGSDMTLQPLEPFTVTDKLPSGGYVLKSRVIDPVTGKVFHEGATAFQIR
jgi:hypothetical protein